MYKMVFANPRGEFFDHQLTAVGRTGNRFVEIIPEDVIPPPQGAGLVLVPGSNPLGIKNNEFALLRDNPYEQGQALAVGATLPQGYTRTLLPAYQKLEHKLLPLLGYAAVVFKNEQIYVAAVQTDQLKKWDPKYYNTGDLPKLIRRRIKKHPHNRILEHLARCSLDYHCFTAQNIFYQRWEGGLPVSPTCNAGCLGCISEQPAECCPSPQSRLNFRPTLEELVEVGADHLEQADQAIISFGQGCEGEPALGADVIARAIKAMRQKTKLGTINMNSNAGYTNGVREIVTAGLDSIRVSIISATPEIYNAYYRPRGYTLENVKESIKLSKENGVFVSLNLLTFPGLTDLPGQIEHLVEFIQQTGVDMVQLRNLNIDPDYLLKNLPLSEDEEPLGIPAFIEILREELPGLKIGNYSKFLR